MQVYKSRMDIEIERKHICEAMMKKWMHCGIINHTRFNCHEFNKQKNKKSEEIEKEWYGKKSKEYRLKIREWRATPICDRCGDLTNPHKSLGCKKQYKCGNCGANEHRTKEYMKCSKAVTMMTNILFNDESSSSDITITFWWFIARTTA